MSTCFSRDEKKINLIKQTKKKHKLGVLCMTFCYSRYGVHVSAALCMMELDEDFVLDTKGKKETLLSKIMQCERVEICSWTIGWFRDEIMLIKDIYHYSLASFVPRNQEMKRAKRREQDQELFAKTFIKSSSHPPKAVFEI